MSLESTSNPLEFGQRIILHARSPYGATTATRLEPLYQMIVSAQFDSEALGQPLTVLISDARLVAEVEGVSQGVDTPGELGPPATYPIDRGYGAISVVVEWLRGNAKYSIECDPGACFVIPATSVAITARVESNDADRYLSASVSRGATPRAGVVSSPKLTVRSAPKPYQYSFGETPPMVGLNCVRIPHFARTFRAVSERGQAVVVKGRRTEGSSYIFCSSWDEVHPVPTGANHLYIMSPPLAVDERSPIVYVEFQLGL